MIPSSVKRRFTLVLKAEQLVAIPPAFSDPAFFDEVPLYSRYEQVAFLKEYGEADQLLLDLSLEYLQRVEARWSTGTLKRFIAVTIIRDDVNELIVPSIFICNSNADKQLKSLHLSAPSKGLGKHIQNLLQQTDHPEKYRVLEDRATVAGDVRVFVGYSRSSQKLVPLDSLLNGASSRKKARAG